MWVARLKMSTECIAQWMKVLGRHGEPSEHVGLREDPKSFQRENSSFEQRIRKLPNFSTELSESERHLSNVFKFWGSKISNAEFYTYSNKHNLAWEYEKNLCRHVISQNVYLGTLLANVNQVLAKYQTL